MKTIELRFDISSNNKDKSTVIDGEELLARALELQYQWINIDWAGLVRADLLVEDNIMFLSMAHEELERIFQTNYLHHVFLGDGLLDVTTQRDGETATMTVRHTPHLDRRFSSCRSLTMKHEMYYMAWQALMRDLVGQICP